MLRTMFGSSLIALTLGCGMFGGKGTKNDSGEDAPPPPESKTTEVAPKSDTEGVVVGGISSSSTDTQLLKASPGSAIDGASISFPPGSLGIDVDVTLEQGVSLASGALESTLGVGKGTLSEAGPAVVVSSEPKTDGVKPFTIGLVVTQSAGLIGTTYVIVHKSYDAATGKLILGIVPTSAFKQEGNLITFETTHFGAFQPFLTTVEITEKIEKETDEPIITIREQKGQEPGATDKTAPTLVQHDAPGAGVPAVTSKQIFKFIFNEAIDPTKTVIGGAMKGDGDVLITAIKTTKDNDTIVVAPVGNWVLGNKDLTISVKDKAGNGIAQPVAFTYEVVDKIYYVDKTGKSKAQGATGAKDKPYNSIKQAADDVAAEEFTSFIYVAKGDYTETIPLKQGVRVLGGFPVDKQYQVRDAAANVTKIIDDTTTGTAYDGPVACVAGSVNETIDHALIDGFTIQNKAGTLQAVAVQISGTHLCRIENNVIHATGVMRSTAIMAIDAPVRIIGNTITTGDSEVWTSGIDVEHHAPEDTEITVARNSVIVGDPTNAGVSQSETYGFWLYDETPEILAEVHDNLFVSGDATQTTAVARGAYVEVGGVRLRNNTLVAKSTSRAIDSSVGLMLADTDPDAEIYIDNNVIIASAEDYTFEARGISASLSNRILSLQNNAIRIYHPSNPSRIGGPAFYLLAPYVTADALNSGDSAGLTWSNNMGSLSEGTVFDPKLENLSQDKYAPKADSPLKGAGLDGKAAGWDFGNVYLDVTKKTTRATPWTIGAFQ